MLKDVVVGTLVNSYDNAEPIDFGCVTTIGAAVNLLAARVTVTVPLNVTVPTWYRKGTHVNSLFNCAAVNTAPVTYVF
jgi:hypothetical protein